MSDLEFSQDEQEQRVKDWWKNNRNSIFMGIGIGLAAVWGWNYYQGTKVEKAKLAASEYVNFLDSDGDATTTDAAIARLEQDFPKTSYTSLAEMARAAQLINTNLDQTIDELTSAVENAPDAGMKAIANIRLARVLVDGDRLDQAQSVVDALNYDNSFASYAYELKGDLLVKQNKDGAKEAYQSAIAKLDASGLDRDTVQLLERKIQSLK